MGKSKPKKASNSKNLASKAKVKTSSVKNDKKKPQAKVVTKDKKPAKKVE